MDERFFDEEEMEQYELIKPSVSGFWSEKVYVITEEFEIKGFVFMSKTGKKNRILSDILNSNKRFVAIKDAEIRLRKNPEENVEINDFIQLNLDSIILIRPCTER